MKCWDKYKSKIIKTGLSAVIVVICIMCNKAYRETSLSCIEDTLFNFTANANSLLLSYSNVLKYLQIFSYGMLDIVVLFTSYLWIIKGTNWRPVMALVLLISFRELCDMMLQLKPDDDILLTNTGFPSFTVNFFHNHFFFSGTIGLYLICVLELYNLDYFYTSYSSIFGIVEYFLLLTSIRSQFTGSLFYGLISAHYFYSLSNQFCFYLNDVYDFDYEANEKKSQIQREKKIQEVIEMTIQTYAKKTIDKDKPVQEYQMVKSEDTGNSMNNSL